MLGRCRRLGPGGWRLRALRLKEAADKGLGQMHMLDCLSGKNDTKLHFDVLNDSLTQFHYISRFLSNSRVLTIR